MVALNTFWTSSFMVSALFEMYPIFSRLFSVSRILVSSCSRFSESELSVCFFSSSRRLSFLSSWRFITSQVAWIVAMGVFRSWLSSATISRLALSASISLSFDLISSSLMISKLSAKPTNWLLLDKGSAVSRLPFAISSAYFWSSRIGLISVNTITVISMYPETRTTAHKEITQTSSCCL